MVDYLSPASGGVGLQGRAAELNEALGVGLSERGGSSYLGTSWRPLIRLTRCSGALVGPDNQVRSEGFFGACNLKLNG